MGGEAWNVFCLKLLFFSPLLAHTHYTAKPKISEEMYNLPSMKHFKINYNGQRHTSLVRK